MKKVIVVGVILLFLGSSIPVLASSNEKSILPLTRGRTLYVGGSGPGNYTTIQDAINNTTDGDIVFVYNDSSPYYECITIGTGHEITLQGEDRDSTIIYGLINDTFRDPIVIRANNVTIQDLTVNARGNSAIYDFGDNSVFYNLRIHRIKNDRLTSNPSGTDEAIFVGYASNCLVQNCMLSDCAYGVLLYDLGIFHYNSFNNRVINSIISHCYIGISSEGHKNIIENNTITQCSGAGIEVDGRGDNKVIHNNISDCGDGIILTDDPNDFLNGHHTISRNKIQYCKMGIYIEYSYSNLITKNDILFNEKDAYFEGSFFNHWRNNYWGHPLFHPKTIEGLNFVFTWGGSYWPYSPPHHFSLRWIDIDWFPSLLPHYNRWH